MGLVPADLREKGEGLNDAGFCACARAVSQLAGEDLGDEYYYHPVVELLYDI